MVLCFREGIQKRTFSFSTKSFPLAALFSVNFLDIFARCELHEYRKPGIERHPITLPGEFIL